MKLLKFDHSVIELEQKKSKQLPKTTDPPFFKVSYSYNFICHFLMFHHQKMTNKIKNYLQKKI